MSVKIILFVYFYLNLLVHFNRYNSLAQPTSSSRPVFFGCSDLSNRKCQVIVGTSASFLQTIANISAITIYNHQLVDIHVRFSDDFTGNTVTLFDSSRQCSSPNLTSFAAFNSLQCDAGINLLGQSKDGSCAGCHLNLESSLLRFQRTIIAAGSSRNVANFRLTFSLSVKHDLPCHPYCSVSILRADINGNFSPSRLTSQSFFGALEFTYADDDTCVSYPESRGMGTFLCVGSPRSGFDIENEKLKIQSRVSFANSLHSKYSPGEEKTMADEQQEILYTETTLEEERSKSHHIFIFMALSSFAFFAIISYLLITRKLMCGRHSNDQCNNCVVHSPLHPYSRTFHYTSHHRPICRPSAPTAISNQQGTSANDSQCNSCIEYERRNSLPPAYEDLPPSYENCVEEAAA